MRIRNLIPGNGGAAVFADGAGGIITEPLISWGVVSFGGEVDEVRGFVIIDGELTDAPSSKKFCGYLPPPHSPQFSTHLRFCTDAARRINPRMDC